MKAISSYLSLALLLLGAAVTQTTAQEPLDEKQKAMQLEKMMAAAQKICPVTGMDLNAMGGPIKAKSGEMTIFLCCKGCFGKQISKQNWAKVQANLIASQKTCPVKGEPLTKEAVSMLIGNRVVFACCSECLAELKAEPKEYLAKVDKMLAENLAQATTQPGMQKMQMKPK